MVAGRPLGPDAALDPAERAIDRSARRALPRRDSIPCQCAMGGTPRAKCCATASWPAASRLTAKAPDSRSSSCSAASRATEIPTSGGSRESETSVPTVNPRPSPSASTVTTATPAGNRCINTRTSPTGELNQPQRRPACASMPVSPTPASCSARPTHETIGVTPGPSAVARYRVPFPWEGPSA